MDIYPRLPGSRDLLSPKIQNAYTLIGDVEGRRLDKQQMTCIVKDAHNHLVIAATPFSVVAKKEIANIPFLKQVFACMKAYMLDRGDVRQAMKVILDVSEEVKKGRNYLIFAEGTRSKQGNRIGEFKGGSFKAATKAKCPIVPVALLDSFKPFDTNTITPVIVQVHFLKPLEYEVYKEMKTTEIAALVHDEIQKTIDAAQNISSL